MLSVQNRKLQGLFLGGWEYIFLGIKGWRVVMVGAAYVDCLGVMKCH